METVSRTVRFKKEELKLIEQFLEQNPFFDFSTLTRVAITEFIKRPSLQIKGVHRHGKSLAGKTSKSVDSGVVK